VTFLSVLQHLLQIDSSDVVGDVIWQTVGQLVTGASMLSGRRPDAERLLADGTRRLSRVVPSIDHPQRRSGQCLSTCQCVCHGNILRLDSKDSGILSVTDCQPSTDTGSSTRDMQKI